MPDEFTYGQGSGTHSGEAFRNAPYYGYEGESDSTYAAFTWHLPPIDKGPSREERAEIREQSLMIDATVDKEIALDETMANGGAYKADWRHAAGFGGLIAPLLIVLLVKLQRSNGWN